MKPDQRSVGWIVLIASVIALVLSAVSAQQGLSFTRCQGRYNEVTNARLHVIADVGATEAAAQRQRDDAIDRLFLDPALLKPAGQRSDAEKARIAALFATYRAAAQHLAAERAAADRARAVNPLPPPPSQTCR